MGVKEILLCIAIAGWAGTAFGWTISEIAYIAFAIGFCWWMKRRGIFDFKDV